MVKYSGSQLVNVVGSEWS